MKKTLSVLLALLCAVLFSLPASAEGFSFGWDTDSKNPDGPHCKAYLMLNLDTDTVVYAENADEPLPMASLTKIMSYIIAYENIPDIENAQITIPQSVVDELEGTGSSVAEFSVGETFTGLQMLYLMMVPSGNNAALTLAKYVDSLYASGGLQGDAASAESQEDPETASSGETREQLAPAYGEEGFDGSDYTGRSTFVQLMNEKAAELGCTNCFDGRF